MSSFRSHPYRKLILSIFALSVFQSAVVFAGDDDPLFIAPMVSIARRQVINPASDLLDAQGKLLDSDDVDVKMRAGELVEWLNPAPTDIWGGDLSARKIDYPAESRTGMVELHFDSLVTSPRGLFRARVVTDDAAKTPFRLAMSSTLHSALMNAELLSQLGYTVDKPKRYAQARLRFDDREARDLFLREMGGGTGTLAEQWLIKTPADSELTIELRDFVLEPASVATPTYYWGAISRNELQNRRVIRALLLPLVLTSIPESINLWTWEVGKLNNERVLLYHPFAGNFQGQLNYADGRWIARKIGAIDEAHLHAIIRAGGYPASIEPLLFEKLKSRRNNLMSLFEMDCAPLPVNPNINIADPETRLPLVAQGKLLRADFPGYGFKFIGPDPQSPLRKDELFRYFKLRGLGAVLSAGLGELNAKLLDFNRTDQNHFLNQKWAFKNGPHAKLNLSATRKLVSGTYYGSESQVQLVDQVSLSASAGWFFGVRNHLIPNVQFELVPNTSVSRSYLHVKPMASIKEALKTPWKDLPVIPKMRSLAKLLDASTVLEQDKALSALLDLFLPGENFSVVDSIDFGASLAATLPLPPLAAAPQFGKLSLSAGHDHLILRRSMLSRQSDGTLQISLQHVRRNNTDFSVNYNFLVNVATGTSAHVTADSDANVFVINPNAVSDKTKLNEALKALLMNNDSSLLEQDFQSYLLNHDLRSKTKELTLLPFTFAHYHEEHDLIAYPMGRTGAESERRELFSVRDRSLTGSDFLGFGTRTGQSLGQELYLPNLNIDLGNDDGRIDPAGSFLGRSHWREVQYEAELTPSLNEKSLLKIQENYGGWTMTKARMLRIVKRLEAKIHEVTGNTDHLVHEEEFLSTSKLLLYQISSVLKVSGPGLDQLLKLAKDSGDQTQFVRTLVAQRKLDSKYLIQDSWVRSFYERLKRIQPRSQDFSLARARIQDLYRASREMANHATAKEIVQLVGEKNAIFYISITGFRKNDENGDSAYLSATLGESNPLVGEGAFAGFAHDQNISTYEVRATYLGNGL